MDKNSSDKVGYKNPPKTTQFKPGQSGNPGGLPKGTPRTYSDEFFLEQIEQLIESGTPSVNPVLPVLNLLNRADREKLRSLLLDRAKELWERLKQVARENSSVKPMEVGADEINKHLEWAARYQVFEERFYSIEESKSKDQ